MRLSASSVHPPQPTPPPRTTSPGKERPRRPKETEAPAVQEERAASEPSAPPQQEGRATSDRKPKVPSGGRIEPESDVDGEATGASNTPGEEWEPEERWSNARAPEPPRGGNSVEQRESPAMSGGMRGSQSG